MTEPRRMPSWYEIQLLRMQGIRNTMEGQCELTEVQRAVGDLARALTAVLTYIAGKEEGITS